MRDCYSILKSPRYVAGTAAVLLSSAFLAKEWNSTPVFLASLFLLVICITDTFFSKIFNISILLLTAAALIIHFQSSGVQGISDSLLGLLCGLSLFLLPYLFGGMGAGDVKALAALGATLGATAIFQVFLHTALIGGLLAVTYSLWGKNPLKTMRAALDRILIFFIERNFSSLKTSSTRQSCRFPYATAITFGFFSYLQWGELI